MAQDNTISIVEKFIETCRDGEKGYHDAAAHMKRPDLKSSFEAQSPERRRCGGGVASTLSKLGNDGRRPVTSTKWVDQKRGLNLY